MGLNNPVTTVEGKGMLEGLLDDLKDTGADYILPEDSKIDLKTPTEPHKCTPIILSGELETWLEENVSRYDACFPVAPEEDLVLYGITKILEDSGVKTIGSSSSAVLQCSDKFETNNLLRDNFPVIHTEKVSFRRLRDHKEIFSEGKKMLVKTADGVSCSGVHVVKSYADLIKAAANLKRTTKLPFFLLQDYLEGRSTSVSVLSTGKSAMPMSLNLQKIGFNNGKLFYTGGEVPYDHRLCDDAMDIAKNAVESIEGLKGYVGVDLLLDEVHDEVFILEINPRLTTSYVALRRLLNLNLTEAIINAVDGKLPGEIEINGSLGFFKGEDITFK